GEPPTGLYRGGSRHPTIGPTPGRLKAGRIFAKGVFGGSDRAIVALSSPAYLCRVLAEFDVCAKRYGLCPWPGPRIPCWIRRLEVADWPSHRRPHNVRVPRPE